MAQPPDEGRPQSGEGSSNAKRPDIRYDDIVAKVAGEPGKPAATLLSGYVGRGDAGRVRIYPDLSFATFHDVAEEDVVHSVPIADSPHGGSHVWVKPSAAAGGGAYAQAPQPQYGQANVPPYTVYPHLTCGFVCHTREDCGTAAAIGGMPVSQFHTCPPCTQIPGPCGPLQFTKNVCDQAGFERWPVQATTTVHPTTTVVGPTTTFQPTGPNICTHNYPCEFALTPALNPTAATRCFICPPITVTTRTGVFYPYGG